MMYAKHCASLLALLVAVLACAPAAQAGRDYDKDLHKVHTPDHKPPVGKPPMGGGGGGGGGGAENQLETARLPQGAQRTEFIDQDGNDAFKFSFSEVGAVTDNEAVLQQRVTKGQNQFLSTLAKDGEAQFLTALKPCGILLPHTHQRANEFYSVVFGIMDGGISQENGFAQDITLKINPGEVFAVPQGLMHYNHNQQCFPNVFFQSFDSADPGALNVIGALAAFNEAGGDGAAAMLASGAESIKASPQGAFALDQACLKRCGFPETGAPGDGLKDLPKEFRSLFALP